MSFSEQPPSTQWAGLKYQGETVAEVWFKPEGEPGGVTFRIPQSGFRIPGVGPWLTPENLLKAVGIAPEEVESWHRQGTTPSGMSGSDPELRTPLVAPAPEVPELELYFKIKVPIQMAALADSGQLEIPEAKWQTIELRWNAIVGLEATTETLRLTMENVRAEMESALNKTLMPEEKLHALRADLDQWTKAKHRIHFALPKLREFVHRATWAMGTPERKQLGELFESHIEPRIPFPEINKVEDELESLFKARQVLSAHGVGVHQECKNILADIQTALRTLQSNAARNARQKKESNRAGGKFFKDVRKWSMGR
jgi:hypothetical protein